MSATDIKEVVKKKYGQAALRVKSAGSTCCGAAPAGNSGCDPITSLRVNNCLRKRGSHPSDVENPTALAQLNPGEVVLDLGSGGGIDVLLSARRVRATWQGVRSFPRCAVTSRLIEA